MAKGMMLGFITGGIVGGLIALLYAPKSGRELRADIKVKKDEYLEDASEYLNTAKEKASTIITESRKKSEQLLKDAKEKASTLLHDANTILNEAKVKAGHSLDNTKHKISEETDRVKDAFNAGIEAYNQEKRKTD